MNESPTARRYYIQPPNSIETGHQLWLSGGQAIDNFIHANGGEWVVWAEKGYRVEYI